MDSHIFFKYLWRFNAMAIAGAALLCFLFVSYLFLKETVFRGIHGTEIVNVDTNDDSIVEKLSIQIGSIVSGKNLFVTRLNSNQGYEGFYSSKSTYNMLNVGFYSPVSGEIRWVFPKNTQLITDFDTLYQTVGGAGEQRKIATGHAFSVVDSDTSGDKRLSNSDLKTVWVSLSDGSGAKKIISGLTSDLDVQYLPGGHAVLFFEDQEGYRSALYDPATQMIGTIQTLLPPQ